MINWHNLSFALSLLTAAACAAVSITTYVSVKGRRRSTPMFVLCLFAMLTATVGLAVPIEIAANRPNAEIVCVALLAVLAVVSIVISIFLTRLLPRAAAFQDTAFLKSAARELRLSKQRFQRAIDGSFNGLWEWYVAENSVWFSPRFRELLGYTTEDEFPDMIESWRSALHPDDKHHVLDALDEHIELSRDYNVEYRLRTRSGAYRWFNARGQAIRDPAGHPYIMSGSIQDIDDRKTAEETLRRQEQYLNQKHKMESLGELAGGAAHEFNNLLQAISGQIQFAIRSLPPDAQAKSDLLTATNLIDQSARFTRQLLDFSRRRPKSMKPVDLNQLVNELIPILRPMLGSDVELRVRLGSQVSSVSADSGSLHQALLNLCLNARDAMPDGGRLFIRTCNAELSESMVSSYPDAHAGPYSMISVGDTGVGMDAETKAKIFEPFFTTKSIGKGTGLGLAVVYSIVKECGGIVDVESDLGHGSTFAICLPAVESPHEQNPQYSVVPDTIKLARALTILYAEDDECIRRTTSLTLEEEGHRVITASDGHLAIAHFAEFAEDIDVALLDIVMPCFNGHEVAAKLRGRRPDLPIVYCSGCASPKMDIDLLNLTDTWLLDKPFKKDDLVETLSKAVREHTVDRCAIG